MRKKKQRLTLWRITVWILLVLAMGRTSYLGSVSLINYIFNEGALIVPDLSGILYDEAERILAPYELEIKQAASKYHPFHKKGTIISQEPYSNTKVKRGRVIRVVVSRGQEVIAVPKVSGKLLAEAEALLRNSGLNISNVCYRYHDLISADHIITTAPSEGASAVRGEKIDLLVSSGIKPEKMLVADLTGQTLDQARQNRKFRVKPRYEYRKELPQGQIFRQNPAPGAVMSCPGVVEVWINEPVIPMGRRHYESVVYDVPGNRDSYLLRFILTDEQGIREVFRQNVAGGERVNYTVSGLGKMKIMIYLDNVMVRELEF